MKRSTRLSLSTALAIAFASPLISLSAQTLYRCGSTYSQTPCAPDAASQRVRNDTIPDTAPGLHGAELCSATANRTLQLGDTEGAVQIDSVAKAPAEVISYADKPTAAHVFVVTLKFKAYSSFTGPHRYACHLSEDERRVLQFSARP